MRHSLLTLSAMLIVGSAQAKTVKTTFAVKGNCAMCQKRIEAAANRVAGVTSARWNKQTGQLSLVYSDKLTTPEKVQQAISAVGHDAGKQRGDSEAYSRLPGCCKYRSKSQKH